METLDSHVHERDVATLCLQKLRLPPIRLVLSRSACTGDTSPQPRRQSTH
jgi:hypothetical protein